MTDREMQDFSQAQLMDQGPMHNSGIDIPKRKDKEDLTESSEVVTLYTIPPRAPKFMFLSSEKSTILWKKMSEQYIFYATISSFKK